MSKFIIFNENRIRKSAIKCYAIIDNTITIFTYPMCFSKHFETKQDAIDSLNELDNILDEEIYVDEVKPI